MSDKVETLYVLMFDDPEHGECISSTVLGHGFPVADVFSAKSLSGGTYMTLDEKVAQMKRFAKAHHERTGWTYRVMKFTRGEVVEQFG